MLRSFAPSLFLSLTLLAGCGGDIGTGGLPGVDEQAGGTFSADAALVVGKDAVVVNTGGQGLRLRNAPSTSGGIIEVMGESARVHVNGGPSSGWYDVTHGHNRGWASGAYLRTVADNGGGGTSQHGAYPATHWIAASSSNYSATRDGNPVQYIVIHDMEGTYSSAINWFQNPAAQAAAHYNIRSSDGEITQMVSEHDTAWHCGNWHYNQRSIGIEHEGFMNNPGAWYTEKMYQQSAKLTAAIAHRYGVPLDRAHILGHDEVPDPNHPGQFGGVDHHRDPGSGWNWSHYMDLVRSYY